MSEKRRRIKLFISRRELTPLHWQWCFLSVALVFCIGDPVGTKIHRCVLVTSLVLNLGRGQFLVLTLNPTLLWKVDNYDKWNRGVTVHTFILVLVVCDPRFCLTLYLWFVLLILSLGVPSS